MRGDGAQRRCRFEVRAAAAPDAARSAVSDENQNRSARIVRVVCLRLLLVPCDNADLGRRRCCFDGSARLMSIRAAASTGWSRTTAQPGEGPSPTRARQHGSFSSEPVVLPWLLDCTNTSSLVDGANYSPRKNSVGG